MYGNIHYVWYLVSEESIRHFGSMDYSLCVKTTPKNSLLRNEKGK